MKFFAGLIVGIFLVVLIPLILVSTGSINMAATETPSRLEEKIGNMAYTKSMKKRAPSIVSPYSDDDAVLPEGLTHYRENCVVCHGAPDVERGEIGQGLNPPAPDLEEVRTQSLSEGELFWTIKNGIRMTGMPAFGKTHTDQEVWKIVAFVRHLPNLKESEKKKLGNVEEEEHHH